uniref:Uncharacterized protein n=1 Tax=Cucumis melo TaxID=3656 RepID=A0A9I9E6E7_CUCME
MSAKDSKRLEEGNHIPLGHWTTSPSLSPSFIPHHLPPNNGKTLRVHSLLRLSQKKKMSPYKIILVLDLRTLEC